MKEKNILIIFTRNPRLGKVKTRLAKTIGNKKALEIYTLLLKKTAEVTAKVKADRVVYYSEDIVEDAVWSPAYFSKKIQKGNDLGERMMQAFKENFSKGYKNAVIIGSDMFDITPNHIEEAFQKLNTHNAVIGPAQDGGYYLLGLKKMHAELFQHKKWGTNSVLRDTLEDLKTVDVALLEELNDIDEYNDIKEHPAFQEFINN
ncbi:TIGR04282 family arsenosugar biosynthesis glycosyltransferase [Galbibacter pacificus]|uniref:TIGR04282 family arsenosugar biosynthesis glycosyltransferase n=1 Tax=Galbibacter pacificus TaxID=2996052 RepID=A0ABT6FW91_9FLAO|nr:TIGR04282 family arsenosugar biosynthesis glycosyltransferase [Galbibacter pacificus]MDG3584023.1 TIGR04282 family arsenosugar biosynthesis glycosyltransferase [Galbibacter pacificus]MDG3587540.1 TIGR04282 family arsenosugar biosynthesis glycosyltransferase [Galbibacter pacificus]